jgi:hypothetical protein
MRSGTWLALNNIPAVKCEPTRFKFARNFRWWSPWGLHVHDTDYVAVYFCVVKIFLSKIIFLVFLYYFDVLII